MSIFRGAAWMQGFVVKAKSTGLPIDISSYTFKSEFQLRASDPNPALVQLTTENGGIVIDDGINGKFSMVMTEDQTVDLPLGRLVFDVVRTDTAPIPGVTYLFGGSVRVRELVSK